MSLIKDYPCPHCGANLFKVGFTDILSGGYETTSHRFRKGTHKSYTDYSFDDRYIECYKCDKNIDVDPEEFLEMVEREWDST